MRTIGLLSFAVLLCACGSKTEEATLADAGDDTEKSGDSEISVGDVEGGTPITTCDTPVAGTEPFSVLVRGSFASDGGVHATEVEAYFPKGRVAGAEVVIAMATMATPRFVVAHGVLDASLTSAKLEVHDPNCGGSVVGTFVGPSGGLEGEMSVNTSGPGTDAVSMASGHALLCPTGATRTPLFSAAPASTSSSFTISGNVPVDVASLGSVKATPPRDLVVTEDGAGFTVAPKMAFPPFEAATIDLSSVRDVMGRSLGFGTVNVLALGAVITDPTFATAPPSGALLGPAVVAGGMLRVPAISESYDALVGLGTAKATKKLRLRHRFDCGTSMDHGPIAVRLVSETGTVVDVVTACEAAPIDVVLDLPMAGRWALSVQRRRYEMIPCWTPSGSGPTAAYELDELAFE